MARRFQLHRDEDVSGVSGLGVVADGVQFRDGVTVLHWLGDDASTVIWPDVQTALRVHGHDGRTRLVWVDTDEATESRRSPADRASGAVE